MNNEPSNFIVERLSHMFDWQRIRVVRMQSQLAFLDTIRARHLMWADNAEQPDLKEMHIQLAESLRQTTAQYLLDSYSQLVRIESKKPT